MEEERRIVIGDKILSRRDLFDGEQMPRKERAKLPFEEKITALVNLQKLIRGWGRKKDVIVWEI